MTFSIIETLTLHISQSTGYSAKRRKKVVCSQVCMQIDLCTVEHMDEYFKKPVTKLLKYFSAWAK